ncbi:hypothetical protein CRM22_006620 [Opisthorchis felineus]|uniref:Uncharacterized protein n=1 Tax=Opisthorchis felineus TaxID=147828 RepID=A0A4V3SEB2_OPIFE|nr:hypothetical protein CRM22_006620 [Opisthorchis felineus]
MLTNSKSLEILNAIKAEQHLQKIQDELFSSSLAYNPRIGTPGQSWFLARYVNWDEKNCPSGLAVRGVCILGWKVIPILVKQPHLFANNFLPDFQPVAFNYMERLYVKKFLLEQKFKRLDPSFDERIFAKLNCSQKHV